jgi:hypothetical protein
VLCFRCGAPMAMIELSNLSIRDYSIGMLLVQPMQWLPQLMERERMLNIDQLCVCKAMYIKIWPAFCSSCSGFTPLL